MTQISWNDFEQVDLRVGTVVRAEAFPEAKKPAIKLWIDFGELGVKASSAQITTVYSPEPLVGRQVLAVVNFPPKRIGPFVSEVLVTGFDRGDGTIVLVGPDFLVPDGARLI